MERNTLRAVQMIQLEIAIKIKEICDKHKIQYFLESGTLLGAIRHGGFIPWDDDLDIGMKREDYEKFIRVASEDLGDTYYLQEWHMDDSFPLPYAKVRKRGTLYIESKGNQVEDDSNAIFVDIFPYDVYVNSYIRQGWPLFWRERVLRIKNGYKPWGESGKDMKKYLLYLPIRFFAVLLDRKRIITGHENVVRRNNMLQSDWLYVQCGFRYGEYKFRTKCIRSTQDVLFEGVCFPAPIDADEVLSEYYGDYMKLPPETERENRHEVSVVRV